MADNVTSGGFTTATKQGVGGEHYQRILTQHIVADVSTDVSAAAPLPVALPAATVTTLTPPPAITGFATEAKQDTGNTSLATLAGAVAGTEIQVDIVSGTVGISGTVPISDAGGSLTVDGTVAVTNADLATLAGAVTSAKVQTDVVSITRPSTIVHGQTNVTTPGTEVVLGSSAALLSGVTVKAKPTNTGLIFVGANPVTSSTGFILDAGEQVYIDISNINLVYVDSAQAGEGVSFVGS